MACVHNKILTNKQNKAHIREYIVPNRAKTRYTHTVKHCIYKIDDKYMKKNKNNNIITSLTLNCVCLCSCKLYKCIWKLKEKVLPVVMTSRRRCRLLSSGESNCDSACVLSVYPLL